jgi:hypothetical protein
MPNKMSELGASQATKGLLIEPPQEELKNEPNVLPTVAGPDREGQGDPDKACWPVRGYHRRFYRAKRTLRHLSRMAAICIDRKPDHDE